MRHILCVYANEETTEGRHAANSQDLHEQSQSSRPLAKGVSIQRPRSIHPEGRERHNSVTATIRLELDRKSTRLNSSHGYISYAVFCLKKKKKISYKHLKKYSMYNHTTRMNTHYVLTR